MIEKSVRVTFCGSGAPLPELVVSKVKDMDDEWKEEKIGDGDSLL